MQEADEIAADRFLETVGLPDLSEGREELRAMIRSFAGMAKAATREWLVRKTLTRDQVQLMLATLLAAIITDVHSRMFDPAVRETS